jgi:HAD superfamily hydrolase (TIGR01509 family)
VYFADKTKFDAGLFDIDGTLVDSERLLHKAWSELVARDGKDFSTFDYAEIFGRPDLDCCRIVSAYYGLDKDPVAWHAVYARIVARLMDAELEQRPGAREILDRFRQSGMKLAVVTSATSSHADQALRKCAIDGYFTVRITADTPGLAARKPDPAPYLLAAERLGVDPVRCIAFEDSPRGLASALAAGCWTLGMPHPHSSAENLRSAHMILASLDELGFH